MGAANEPRQARIRVERRLPLGVETKARSCRGCGRTFSTGSYTRRTQRRPRDRARGTGDEEEPLAVGSQMEDEEKAATDEKRDGEREGRARDGLREGGGVYNATIAGCDRSCELRAGNLGTVYANLSARRMRARGGEGNGMMGERARW